MRRTTLVKSKPSQDIHFYSIKQGFFLTDLDTMLCIVANLHLTSAMGQWLHVIDINVAIAPVQVLH